LTACFGLLFYNSNVFALEFKPGVGVGLEYTDNAKLTSDDQVDDLIAVGYIGAQLEENDGPVTANITAALNHHRYTKDTFEDRRYFNLGANVGWEMIKDRFDWFLRDAYRQRPINSADPNTPDNIQDVNFFNFGANMVYPFLARQTFTLRPEYQNSYLEQATDSQQISLFASWNYQVNSVTYIGLNASIRTIDYDNPFIADVTFSSIFFAASGSRARSEYTANLGTTYVNRSNGQGTEEFAGNLDWMVNLTSRSRVRAFISTDLTDTRNAVVRATVDPGLGDSVDIQVTTDVIRNQVMTLGYHRQDGTLKSGLTGALRQLNYSETPNDRKIISLNAAFNYPVTALLISGLYARYNNTDYIDAGRTDNNYTVGGNVKYQLSRNLNSSLDLKYRNKDSTVAAQNFDEWSVYFSLVYGFGQPLRPTRSGGF
jgi:hypothetical protein